MKIRLISFILALITLSNTVSADLSVWTETNTVRILRHYPAGKTFAVELSAARNEWESFQILMRPDMDVTVTNIIPGDLKGPEDSVISGRESRLYRQHQFELVDPSYRNGNFEPGWYPDALIPFEHPLTRKPLGETRFSAVPFDLHADQTHGFWVDIFVPENTRPGKHRGIYTAEFRGGKKIHIPVTLTVWDFTLPRASTLVTALGSPALRMRGYYRDRAEAGKETEPKDWDAVEKQVAEMVSRHRINAYPPEDSLKPVELADGSYRVPEEQITTLRDFIDTWHVNAVRLPRATDIFNDPVNDRDRLFAWFKSYDDAIERLNRPDVLFYTYLRDEPNTEEQYKFVQTWGRLIREAHSTVKVMVVEQTWTAPGAGGQDSAWGDLYGAVDIWCPLFSLFREEYASKRQALGETIWTYTALCQREPTPWWETDFPLLNYRVPSWIAWRYRIRGLLYWGGMSYWGGVEDPWTDPKTLDRRHRNPEQLYNGDGMIVYPGRAAGYDGIAPSLRLKALRDSIEDYEYLAILERAGLENQAQEIIMPLAGSWFTWETNPAAYKKARVELAKLILTITKKY